MGTERESRAPSREVAILHDLSMTDEMVALKRSFGHDDN
jgi:hypothetical protein